ncbi:MAG TPA: alpha/beta hydrolase [Ktedonobacterales bacterium]|jgi:pimeloyl-ACP methyl ester carboxylesterase
MTLASAPQETYISTNGIRLHAMMQGEHGPLVVLLHGFPECWYSWRHYLPFLAEHGYRAVAPDLRGYNLSDKPKGIINYQTPILARDVYELIHALGEERAIVVGHDWGGAIAWNVAMYYPQAVEKLAVCNLPHPAKFAEGIRTWRQLRKSWYIFTFQLPWLPEYLMQRDLYGTLERVMRGAAARKDAISDDDLRVYAEALGQPGALTATLNYYRAVVRWGWRVPSQPINAPTQIIWGEEDIVLGKELTYGTEKYVPDLRIHYIPNCGHWVQQEAQQEVQEVLLEFLGRS